ncbi:nickel transporter [candidate division KSB3 bacterium]|uniref:Nickel transporter n=1 Tax=candidate division KSB3 bacterium TaxID=2044937 RepID=A0A2G6E6D7_9BACT|nr:MAG: nickel transporter [candidate division KSB3 bacterium]PIE29983.1 MAG: nickel transporter [candidate division KSB3 bacterium]
MKKLVTSLVLMAMVVSAPAAFAHFQMIYTPKAALGEGDASKIPLTLVFTHPFEAGHTMNMGMDASGEIHAPTMFSVTNKGTTTDLLESLKPITFKSLTNEGQGYETSYRLKGMGDFIFCLDPGPYYEESEESYIQQITKVIVNKGGAPTDWDAELGLPVEIVPLDKPYALWTGNVFRGVVMRKEGDKMVPVPFAEIEVEYMNHDIDGNSFVKAAKVEAPNDNMVTMGIKANKDGEFSFGIPKAGWWGFCALGAGGDLQYDGKALSLDAVIWIQAVDID